MIECKKVEGIEFGLRTLTSYVLLQDGLPLVVPTAFLFNTAKNNKFTTVDTYQNLIKQFFTGIERSKRADGSFSDWNSLTDNEMSGYLYGHLQQKKKLKDSSIELHIAAISGFYRYAYAHGFTARIPDFSFSYQEANDKSTYLRNISTEMHDVYFTEKEFKDKLVSQVKEKCGFNRERNELILALGYMAGFRTFEVTQEENMNVENLREKLPKVENRLPSTLEFDVYGKGSVYRTVIFPVSLVDIIYKFLWGRAKHIKNGNLICRKNGKRLIGESFATKLFRKCADRYCIRPEVTPKERQRWKDSTYHKGRKCFATNAVALCIELGKDPWVYVPQWMGHTDKQITFGYIYFDALLNKREGKLAELSLENTQYGKRHYAKKGNK
ncbi:site-specific integrase [Colwellia demingiae]|uniref:Site-specific integrase n=1 Tax=Colwellia demingiae TaxID=89401 RepID=A0A5C6QM63_9GAMM|nr:site-specific integrase [Colwellia demingiae]TWX69899.1 site-specific integrase [Colwellia demingiae]